MIKNNIAYAIAIATFVAAPVFVSAQTMTDTTPVVTSTSTSGLIVSVTSPTTVIGGGTNVTLANIRFDGAGLSTLSTASIPVTVQFNGGVSPDDVTNCRLTNTVGNMNLTSGNNALAALLNGVNVFTLNTPVTTAVGTATNIALSCDVSASARGTMQITVNPGSFVPNSTLNGSGTAVTPTFGTTANGTTAPTSTTVSFSGTGTTIPTTPTLPNTGFGGNGTSVLYLLASLFVMATGGMLLKRNLAQR